MARMTAKRAAAQTAAAQYLKMKYTASIPSDQLYQALQDKGYIWDAQAVEWKLGSTSIFKDEFGEPSGVIRLRVMAHQQDVHQAVHALQGSNLKIVEVSEPYPNRKGAGVRVYVTCLIL